MRRAFVLLAVLLVSAGAASAQIGKHVTVRAGTAEDRALTEIYQATDSARKLELLEEFLAEFGDGDHALLAYEIYIAHYLAENNFDKVFEYGEKALSVDPDSFNIALSLFRAAQQKNDAEKVWHYGEKIGGILSRFRASEPPEGTEKEFWEQRKADNLEREQGNIVFVEYTLFTMAFQTPDARQKAALFERFVNAFPDSQYAANAEALVATTYQQTQQFDKMLAFAQKVLQRNPDNAAVLLLLADYYSERGEKLDDAEAYATHLQEVLAAMERPEHVPEEQWQLQKSLQQGLTLSVLGQVHVHKNRNAQAVEAFQAASPLLAADNVSYARNLYRLGFTLAKMKRIPEARRILTEAVGIDSPYRTLARQTLDQIGGPIR